MSNKAMTEADVPSYLQDVAGMPSQEDNFDSTDVVVPQVLLLQGISNAVTEFEDANAGNFWHTGMDVALGDMFKFVVASRRKRYLLLTPQFDGRGILARSEDAVNWDRTGKWEVALDKKTKAVWEIADRNVERSGLTSWGTFDPDDDTSPPAATLFYDYLVLLPDHLDLGPCVVSLARSAIRRAKKGLNDKIDLHRMKNRPMQSILFEAHAVDAVNDTGQSFHNWSFRQAGFAPEDLYKEASHISDIMVSYKVKDEGGE